MVLAQIRAPLPPSHAISGELVPSLPSTAGNTATLDNTLRHCGATLWWILDFGNGMGWEHRGAQHDVAGASTAEFLILSLDRRQLEASHRQREL